MARILIAGESWITTTTHAKGVDEFTVHSYAEGVTQLRTALTATGHDVVHLPGHLVPTDFPETAEALGEYDVIVLSDIGANSLQLAPGVFERSIPGADRVATLADWVTAGGALLMIGGYLSFSGWQARGAYAGTRIAEVLPVDIAPYDDRVELPAGGVAAVVDAHPVIDGVDGAWPALLGYNRTVAKPDAVVPVLIDGDPLVAVRTEGSGRTAVFTSDCSPHWAPPAFCEDWAGYPALFDGLVRWLTAR
ncbi:glutamine amidotransferase [Curtobacterium sp. ZW137]|uniref:glutamine amidotransferase n=1 Tax=Curtobacterium sp. ZW137 TaxID=2485104 RepID=UPI000F4BA9C9|nr:glutamine amidotransferase [Curtobacterium sp. ZW137]ROP58537.1 putative membrane protein [Curtobacterium sp. ZW137]